MPRYKLTLEYDGRGLVGWQRQANGLSMQEVLETAAERFCGEPVTVHGAGRTDAGVHALGQTAHLDLPREAAPETIRNALNFHVKPAAVAVLDVTPVAADFDARRWAVGRRYLYRILNRRAPPTLERGRVWHVGRPLDAEAMQSAARLLLGRHDFTTFRDSLCQAKSPVKTLDRLDVMREGDEIRIAAAARSFLHHQVRNMVGTLKLVGAGKWRVEDVAAALAARDRRAGGPTAPPDGLYLVTVLYPEAGAGSVQRLREEVQHRGAGGDEDGVPQDGGEAHAEPPAEGDAVAFEEP
jgi:tRNA pseudouridine38-40 synthase